ACRRGAYQGDGGAEQQQHVAEEEAVCAQKLYERSEEQDGVVVVDLPVVAISICVEQRMSAEPATGDLQDREEIERVVQAFEEADLRQVEDRDDPCRAADGDRAGK